MIKKRKKTCVLHKYLNEIIKDFKFKLSYKQIAKKYNVSVGTVAGFVAREIHKTTKNKKEFIEIKQNINYNPLNIKDPLIIEESKNKCKFPIGDPKKIDFKFCDKDKIENSSYCNKHHKLCYLKNTKLILPTYLYK